jgi:hypothetical protein
MIATVFAGNCKEPKGNYTRKCPEIKSENIVWIEYSGEFSVHVYVA